MFIVTEPAFSGVTLNQMDFTKPFVDVVHPVVGVGNASSVAAELFTVAEPPHGTSTAPEHTSLAGGGDTIFRVTAAIEPVLVAKLVAKLPEPILS